MICPECHTMNNAGDRFCEQCGTPLPAAAPTPPPDDDSGSIATLLSSAPAAPAVLIRLDSNGERYDLGPRASVGRLETCDIAINDKSVSREHARLSRLRDGYVIEDLGSTNGTLVNGRRIGEAVLLRPGDAVTFGSVEFRYEVDSSVPAQTQGEVAAPDTAATMTDVSLGSMLHSPPEASSPQAAPLPAGPASRPHVADTQEDIDPDFLSFPPLEPVGAPAASDPVEASGRPDIEPAAPDMMAMGREEIPPLPQEPPTWQQPPPEPDSPQAPPLEPPPTPPSPPAGSPQAEGSGAELAGQARDALQRLEGIVAALAQTVRESESARQELDSARQELHTTTQQLDDARRGLDDNQRRLDRAQSAQEDARSLINRAPPPSLERGELEQLQEMLDQLIASPRDVALLMEVGKHATNLAAALNDGVQARQLLMQVSQKLGG